MKKLSVFALVMFLQSFAWAGIAGHWVGEGQWSYDGSAVYCGMKMSFAESATEFKRVGGYFDCNLVGMQSDPLTWTKNGEELLNADGSKAGFIRADRIEFQEDYSENVKITTTIHLHGQTFDYSEIWYDKGEVLYEITGTFKQQ